MEYDLLAVGIDPDRKIKKLPGERINLKDWGAHIIFNKFPHRAAGFRLQMTPCGITNICPPGVLLVLKNQIIKSVIRRRVKDEKDRSVAGCPAVSCEIQ